MATLIFTADDYGFCDSVDKGIRNAVENGMINSVAAFGNGPQAWSRLEKLKSLNSKLNNEGKPEADIGIHLTITSGQSKRIKGHFTDGDGYFRKYTNLKRKGTRSAARRKAIYEQLLAEFRAQLLVFKDAGIKVKHVSSHHNALTFFPEYMDAMVEFAWEIGARLRSAIITPEKKHLWYMFQLQID